MRSLIFIVTIFCIAQAFSSEVKLVNQVIFQVQKEAVTTYDFRRFLEAKQELKIERLLQVVQNELEEFIMFKLSQREVENLDFQLPVTPKNKNLPEEQRQILLVQTYLKLKEKHISEIDRYNSWRDLLKRKYNFQAKIDELKR